MHIFVPILIAVVFLILLFLYFNYQLKENQRLMLSALEMSNNMSKVHAYPQLKEKVDHSKIYLKRN